MDRELEELKLKRIEQLKQAYTNQAQRQAQIVHSTQVGRSRLRSPAEAGLAIEHSAKSGIASERQQAEAETAQQLEAIEEIVKAHLTREALQRYGTLKLAHPETATHFAMAVAQAIQTGRLKGLLSEEQMVNALKQLSKLTQKDKSTRSIIRK